MTAEKSRIKQSGRLYMLDSARAVTICLVVVGHFFEAKSIAHEIVYSFHVPVFFFISGWLLKPETKLLPFAKKRAKRLLLPYFVLLALSLVRYLIKPAESIELFDLIKNIFFWNGNTVWNYPLWFFPALFSVELVFVCLIKTVPKKWIPAAVAAIAAAGGIAGGFLVDNRIFLLRPFGFFRIPTLITFTSLGFLTGLIIKKRGFSPSRRGAGIAAVGFLCFCVAAGLFNRSFNGISFYAFDMVAYPRTMLFAIAGTFLFVFMFQKTGRSRIVELINRYVFFIVGTHFLFVAICKKININDAVFAAAGVAVLAGYLVLIYLIDALRKKHAERHRQKSLPPDGSGRQKNL